MDKSDFKKEGTFCKDYSKKKGSFAIFVKIKDPIAKIIEKKNYSKSTLGIIMSERVKRLENSADVAEACFIFSFFDNFDERNSHIFEKPLEVAFVYNARHKAKASLDFRLENVMVLNEVEILLTEENENPISAIVYAYRYEPFDDFFKFKCFGDQDDREFQVLERLIKLKNAPKLNLAACRDFDNKIEEVFEGMHQIDLRDLFKKLIYIENPRRLQTLKVLLEAYNPYKQGYGVDATLHDFVKYVFIPYKNEKFIKDFLRTSALQKDYYGVFTIEEIPRLLLESLFEEGEDPKGYFKNLAEQYGDSVNSWSQEEWLMNDFITPNFAKDCIKAVKSCECLFGLKWFESYITQRLGRLSLNQEILTKLANEDYLMAKLFVQK